MDNDRRKIELANSMLLTLPGSRKNHAIWRINLLSAILYYGDEIGMGDNIWMEDRNGVRTPMQWDDSAHGGFSSSNVLYMPVVNTREYGPHKVNVEAALKDPGSLFNVLRNMLMRRRKHQALGSGKLMWLDNTDKAVGAWIRYYGMDAVLVVSNLSDRPKLTRIHVPKRFTSVNEPVDILTGEKLNYQAGKLSLSLDPYQYIWIDLALV